MSKSNIKLHVFDKNRDLRSKTPLPSARPAFRPPAPPPGPGPAEPVYKLPMAPRSIWIQASANVDAIKKKAYENTPILGICLGMQLLFTKSNEIYETNGLNLIEGDVVKLSNNINGIEFKVPNIGWRQTFLNEDHSSLILADT